MKKIEEAFYLPKMEKPISNIKLRDTEHFAKGINFKRVRLPHKSLKEITTEEIIENIKKIIENKEKQLD